MEPSHPVDPIAAQSPAIPQARRRFERSDESPIEFGVAPTPEAVAPDEDLPIRRPGEEEPASTGSVPLEDEPTGGNGQSEPEGPLPSVWNRRSAMLVVLAVVMALGAAAVGTFYVMYTRATEPDRSDPSVVVRKYVDAFFNSRDSGKAREFTCSDPASIGQSQQLLTDILAKEAQYGVRIRVSVGGFGTTSSDDRATVTARLRQIATVDGQSQERIERWSFLLRKESGWRVCGAERIP